MQQDSPVTFESEIQGILGQKMAEYASQNQSIDMESPEFLKQFNGWAEDARKQIRKSVYQEAMQDLLAAGVKGIKRRDVGADGEIIPTRERSDGRLYDESGTDVFGELYADDDSSAHEFAVIRQNMYERGRPLMYWDEWERNRPSKLQAAVRGGFIDASLAWEGGARGIGEYVAKIGADLAMPDRKVAEVMGIEPEALNLLRRLGPRSDDDKKILARYEEIKGSFIDDYSKDHGAAWAGAARWLSNYLPGTQEARMRLMGHDPENVQDIRDVTGRAGGGFMVKAGEMTGSAMGIIPYSVPALLSRNPRIAAMMTTPFYAMGHSDAWNRRMEIYRDQLAHARANGLPDPARPSLSELQGQSRLAGAIEFGSEYTIDRVQVMLPALINATPMKAARLSPDVLKKAKYYGNDLLSSLSRRHGVIGAAKVPIVAAAGGVTEAIEEAIPEAGKEIIDPLYIPEGYENDFFSADTAEAMGTGLIAGLLTTGGAVAVKSALPGRRKEKEAARRAAGFMAGVIENKAARLATDRLVQNSTQAYGPTMALHQLDEIQSGDRAVIFIDQRNKDKTLTPDVRQRMDALEVGQKPIGMVGNFSVYAQNGRVEEAREAIRTGNIAALTGHQYLKDPKLPAVGAMVVRNKAEQIVEVIPYSSTDEAKAALPDVEFRAARYGYGVTMVDGSQLPAISESLEQQAVADITMRGLEAPKRKNLAVDKARGIKALHLELATDAHGSRESQKQEDRLPSAPFTSSYLTAQEIGDATNADVEVDTKLFEVNERNLSKNEKRIALSTGINPTILDGSVTFRIKRKDGKVDVYEKPINKQGAYLGQQSPDGVFLIRENGTAFTARNALAIMLHELRHQLVGRSRGGAQLVAQLMYLDPVLAMRGGLEYVREAAPEEFATRDKHGNIVIMDDLAMLGRMAALYSASESILTDPTASAEDKAEAMRQREKVEMLAEESAATAIESSTGQVLTKAVEFDAIYKNQQGISAAKLTAWMASKLAKAGWAGPWARQALFEIQQRMQGKMDEELLIHQQMQSELTKQYMEDAEEFSKVMEGSRSQAAPAVGSIAAAAGGPLAALAGGDDDEKVADASKALADYSAKGPEEKGQALSSAISALAAALPVLASATATTAGVGGKTRGVSPEARQAPAVGVTPQEVQAETEPPAPEAPQTMNEAEREILERQRAEGTPMFSLRRDIKENWAATSKAVDDGELTTVYVGNPTGFMEFDSQRMGRTSRPVSIGAATSSTTADGMWFTDYKDRAETAAQIKDVDIMPQLVRILNAKTKILAKSMPESALDAFEENNGIPLEEYYLTSEDMDDLFEDEVDDYEGMVRYHADFIAEMMDNDPAAIAKIDQAFSSDFITKLASDLAGSRGGVMRAAHLKLENPLIVPFKTGELISTERGVIREDEPFVTQASDALDQMRANGNDGIIMQMDDGERRYFVRSPSQVQIIGAARDAREASMFAQRPSQPVEFFSALQRAVSELPDQTLSASGWKQRIRSMINKGDVKQAEMEWSGLEDMLDLDRTRKYTKDEISAFMRESPMRVDTNVIGEDSSREWSETRLKQYEKFTIPGGSNYREILLQLPHDLVKMAEDQDFATFESSHFAGYENPVAHIRTKDRVGQDNSKVLFVEEIQSDWAQSGRKKGFRGASRGTDIDYRVPRAPFVESTEGWLNLSLKRIIMDAINGGYDRVAFVNGQQSADRYDLRKHIRGIEYTKHADGYEVKVWTLQGSGYESGGLPSRIPEDRLEEYLGKELAEKIVAGDGFQYKDRPDTRSIDARGLTMGGKGMIDFYDKIIPAAVNKLLKKIGGGKAAVVEAGTEDQQIGFDITDEMRQSVTKAGGMAMFAQRRDPDTRITDLAIADIRSSDAMFSRRRTGKAPDEPAATIATTSLDNAQKIAGSKKWDRNRDLKEAMQDAALKAAAKDGINIRPMLSAYVEVAEKDGTDADGRAFSKGDKIIRSRSQRKTILTSDPDRIEAFEKSDSDTRSYLVKVGVKDAIAALSQNKTAKGWYDLKTRIALGVIALIHPEIITDVNARFAFIYALAVTSNGMKVVQNFQLADKVYREFRRTGRMPTTYGVGKPADAMNDAFIKFNQLVETWGPDNLRRMMMTEMTAGDVAGLDKDLAIDGEWAETVVRGAAFLGPKIGNGFFSNLNGMFDALTMDRWLIRTWGRWTGTLISDMPEQTAAARERMTDAIKALTPKQRQLFEKVIGSPIDADPDVAAVKIAKRLTAKKRRDKIPQTKAMQEVRLAANSLDKYLDGQKEAPSGPAERNMIRDVFEDIIAQVRMNPEYSDLTMADLQAALWYAEKRLYENSKETSDEKTNSDYNDLDAPDYANAASALANEAGIDSAAIKAVEEYENGRTGNARPSGVGQAPVQAGAGQPSGARGFAPKELAEFRSWVAANAAREGRIRDQGHAWNYNRVGGTGGRSRLLKKLGITFVDEWNPGDKLRRTYRRNGLDAPKFYELERTSPNAAKFRSAIANSRDRSTYGAAVYIYGIPEYAEMRLFLSEDGKAGFALKDDGDVVSVFSDKSVKHGRAAIELSLAAGGTKLDCFDTILPRFYSSHGFRVAHRLQWDDAQAPSDWSKETFSKFNNGEPDVVFMAHDPNAAPWSRYDAKLMTRTTDYGEAVREQQKAIESYARADSAKPSGPIQAQFSMRRGARGVRDEAALRYIDKFDELLRYVRIAEQSGTELRGIANPYTGARILGGVLGAMQLRAEARYADILRRMHLAGVTTAEMDRFLLAQHAEERNRYVASINPAFPDGGSGMTTTDARNYLAMSVASGRFPVLEGFANEWRAMLNESLVMRRDAGIVSQEMFDALNSRYKRYVPLRGAPAQVGDEDFEGWGEPGGSGLSTTGRGVPRALGRRSEALGVTSQVAYVHEDSFRRVQRNQIGQAFLGLVLAVGDVNMAQVIRPRRRVLQGGTVRYVHDMGWMQDPRNFGVYVNEPMTIGGHNYEPGDLVVIRINNRRLADAMTTPTLELRSFERALTNVNNVWRFMTTGMGNPAFAPVNMIRDVGQATLNNLARRGIIDTAQMMSRWPSAFMRVWRDAWFGPRPTGTYAEFVDAGGDMVAWRGNDLDAKRADFEALANRVARRDPNDRGLARTLLGWYSGFFAASETAARLAQFEQRMETADPGLSIEDARAEAALAARDITVDFSKGGLAKPVLNTWYMFLNAGLQGSVNVLGAVARSVTLAPSLVMLGYVQAFMARMMSGDDEDSGQTRWDLVPDYEKTSNLHFYDPVLRSGTNIKVPIPYGYNVFFSAGVRLENVINGRGTVGDMFAGMLTDALNAFNPIGGSGIKGGTTGVLTSILPTAVRPLGELATNQDFAGKLIYPEQYGKYKAPDSSLAFDGTPGGYIATAEWLNEITGGDEFEPGLIDVSPNTLEYLVGYYFSGTGRMLNRIYKFGFSDEETSVNDIPIMRSFIGRSATDTRAISQQYNEIAASMAPTMRRVAVLEDEDAPPELKQRAFDTFDLSKGPLVETLKATDKALSEIRQLLKTAEGQGRQDLLDARRKVQKALIRRKNELTDQLRALE